MRKEKGKRKKAKGKRKVIIILSFNFIKNA